MSVLIITIWWSNLDIWWQLVPKQDSHFLRWYMMDWSVPMWLKVDFSLWFLCPMWKCRHIHSLGLVCFKVWYPWRRPASTQVEKRPFGITILQSKDSLGYQTTIRNIQKILFNAGKLNARLTMAQPVNLDGEGLSAEHGKHKESVTQNCKEDFLRKNVRFGRTIQLKRGLSHTRHYRWPYQQAN